MLSGETDIWMSFYDSIDCLLAELEKISYDFELNHEYRDSAP